jgi:sulfur carrier protein
VKVKINGEVIDYNADSATLEELLLSRDFVLDNLVVSIGERIITKGEFATTIIKENDDYEVLRFVGGG